MTDGSLLGVDVIGQLRTMGAGGVKVLCTGSSGVLSAAWPRPAAVDLLWGKDERITPATSPIAFYTLI